MFQSTNHRKILVENQLKRLQSSLGTTTKIKLKESRARLRVVQIFQNLQNRRKFPSHLFGVDPAIILPVGLLEAAGTPPSRVELRRAVEGLVPGLVAPPAVVNLGQGAVSARASRASGSGGAGAGVLHGDLGVGSLGRVCLVLRTLRQSLQGRR